MRKLRAPEADPTAIGNVASPPFVRLPAPHTLFADRAARFATLAPGNPLGPYLTFLAALSQVQDKIQHDLPAPVLPPQDILDRAAAHAMPPLDRSRFTADPGFDPGFDTLFTRFTSAAQAIAMPDDARAALARLHAATAAARASLIENVLADAIPVEAIAEHSFLAAALQVHFARSAAALDPATLGPVADGACPACGGPPGASLVVAWANAEGARFCACALCATLWNHVRARCTLCGSTKDITFQQVESTQGAIKAECCGQCRGYAKIFYQDKDPTLDPVADDVATLGLDILVKNLNYKKGTINPYITGY